MMLTQLLLSSLFYRADKNNKNRARTIFVIIFETEIL